MFPRIAALIACLLVFGWMRSADQQHCQRYVAGLQQSRIRLARLQKQESIRQSVAGRSGRNASAAQPADSPNLPAGIQPGLYRVLDSRGATLFLEVTKDQVEPEVLDSHRPPRDFYVLADANRHWIYETIPSKSKLNVSNGAEKLTTTYPTGECLESEPLMVDSEGPPQKSGLAWLIVNVKSIGQRLATETRPAPFNPLIELRRLSSELVNRWQSGWTALHSDLSDFIENLSDNKIIAEPQPKGRAL